MPELPDVVVYIEALQRKIGGSPIEGIELRSPFLVRTVEPPLPEAVGREIIGFRRLGKRIVWELEDGLFLVFHLMIAGRFHWKKIGTRPTRKVDLAAFHFSSGTLMLTEAGSRKRASLHVVDTVQGLAEHDPGGLEVIECDLPAFREALQRENHTLKRAPRRSRLVQRHRQCLLRRDSTRGAVVAGEVDEPAQRGGDRKTARGDADDSAVMDRASAAGSGGCFPREGDRLPPGDGGAWALRKALSGVPDGDTTHRVRRPRDQLLPLLPDRWQDPRRSPAVPSPQGGLATHR